MRAALTLATLVVWMGVLCTVAIILVTTADGSGVGISTASIFAMMFIAATVWTHFLLELRLWKQTQWHLFIASPAVCIGLWFLLSGQILLAGLWFFLLFTAEVGSSMWIVPLADRCYERWLRRPYTSRHHPSYPLHSSHSPPFPHLIKKDVSSPTLQQRWYRFFDADGNDTVECEVAVSFQPNERQTSIHIPFIPPFDRTPHLEMEPMAEMVDVEFVPVQLYTYGVKIMAKRKEYDDKLQVVSMMIVATTAPQIP